jgi:hypothetical protein
MQEVDVPWSGGTRETMTANVLNCDCQHRQKTEEATTNEA